VAKKKADLLQGTLDLLVLKTLALEPMHGWGISQRIQQISQGVLNVNQGSLYPALYRLEEQGWIKAAWDVSDNNRQAKYYANNWKKKQKTGSGSRPPWPKCCKQTSRRNSR
jgi:PadR family transcriptional regulator, regulatory protein PadR